MIFTHYNFKIFNSIVCLYAVHMMNLLIFFKSSLKMLFHYVSMFHYPSAINGKRHVPLTGEISAAFPIVIVQATLSPLFCFRHFLPSLKRIYISSILIPWGWSLAIFKLFWELSFKISRVSNKETLSRAILRILKICRKDFITDWARMCFHINVIISQTFELSRYLNREDIKPMVLRTLFFSLLLCSPAFAAPPTRVSSYVNDSVISSDEVSNNENALFNYLQAGVDTYKDNTIVNADVAASANIQSDKLNLASIGQDMAMSSALFSFAKGSDVASATSITLGSGNFFDITGTTTITGITAKAAGTVVILQFDSSLTVTDGTTLRMAGNFSATANDILVLISDGTNYYEVSRSAN